MCFLALFEYRHPDYNGRKYDTMAQRARDAYVAQLKQQRLSGTEQQEDARAGAGAGGATERPGNTWEARLRLSQTSGGGGGDTGGTNNLAIA